MRTLELANWVKDGDYRMKILLKLEVKPMLPSELADALNINRTSVSRILRNLKEKGLVNPIYSESRTITYTLTPLGKELIMELKK